MSEQPTIRERISKSNIQPLKDMVKEIDEHSEQQDSGLLNVKHPRQNCILDVDSPTLPPERDEYLQCGCASCRAALAKVKEGK